MVRVAVVEDDAAARRQLKEYLLRYEREQEEPIRITEFSSGLEITEAYTACYDLILMDIQMNYMDGMQTAQWIRERDQTVIIIFITNLAQFAIEGYKVDALDYLLKPVQYFAFAQAMQKAVSRIRQNATFFLHLMQESRMIRLDVSGISYIESQGHNVVYHTGEGTYSERGSLKSLEDKLAGQHFCRCNSCYLVNLAQVEQVDQNRVTVSGQTLQISRSRRKGFMEALTAYVGGE
ncbi:MAG: LytTR family DNA-binding domain-containing protein [Clostridiales bacterium]|nr:LytTR family DNA-binding domain-containing protein [Clostridiales bacterium]